MATITDSAPSAETPADESPGGRALGHARESSRFPLRTTLMGFIGSVVLLVASLGAGGILVHDPVLGSGPLSWIRYGHGHALATALLYGGFGLVVWAWVRLGRYALAGRVTGTQVVLAALTWMAPLLVAPPLFTRDVFSYLGQGAQLLHGLDPYDYGPAALDVLPSVVENVHPLWQTTPAPYGPLFLLVAKNVVAVTGNNMIAGVIATRLLLLVGLAGMVWALPRLVRHLGGRLPVTMWLAVASPMTVIHLVGGPHNDLLMLAFLTVGLLAALERKHVVAMALVTVGMLIKPTAAVALPFLVWIWANHLSAEESLRRRFVKAVTPSLAIFGVVFVAGTWISLGSFNLGWVTGLQAPQIIANWLNFPTGIGEVFHTLVNMVVEVPVSPFVTVARGIAWACLVGVMVWQWWKARHGGREAVLRMAVTLLAVALFAPPTLPWYLTWGFVIASAFAWRRRHLAVVVGVSMFLVLAYYPTGEQSLYDWWFVTGVVAASLYGAVSLLRPDPLGLIAVWRRGGEAPAGAAAPEPEAVDADGGAPGAVSAPVSPDGQAAAPPSNRATP